MANSQTRLLLFLVSFCHFRDSLLLGLSHECLDEDHDDKDKASTPKAVESKVVEGHLGVLGDLNDDTASEAPYSLAEAGVSPPGDTGERCQRARLGVLRDEVGGGDLGDRLN